MENGSNTLAAAKKLEGKVALITGGSSGIGECTARLFCQHGAKVVIADVQDNLGISLCNSLGPNSSFVHCDVTDEDDISRAVDLAVEKFGKLDIMFNNACIFADHRIRIMGTVTSILETKKADFERVMAVNLVGPFLGTKHAARVMIPACAGAIVTTSSIAGSIGGASSHAYTCAKTGVVGLTKNAAVELGRFGIRVNCVSPAGVPTPLTTGFLQMPDAQVEALMSTRANLKGPTLRAADVANAVLYLASDDSQYVSGHNLAVDGGCSIVNPSFNHFDY